MSPPCCLPGHTSARRWWSGAGFELRRSAMGGRPLHWCLSHQAKRLPQGWLFKKAWEVVSHLARLVSHQNVKSFHLRFHFQARTLCFRGNLDTTRVQAESRLHTHARPSLPSSWLSPILLKYRPIDLARLKSSSSQPTAQSGSPSRCRVLSCTLQI